MIFQRKCFKISNSWFGVFSQQSAYKMFGKMADAFFMVQSLNLSCYFYRSVQSVPMTQIMSKNQAMLQSFLLRCCMPSLVLRCIYVFHTVANYLRELDKNEGLKNHKKCNFARQQSTVYQDNSYLKFSCFSCNIKCQWVFCDHFLY